MDKYLISTLVNVLHTYSTRQICLIQASLEPHEKCHLPESLKVDITFYSFPLRGPKRSS